MRALLRMSRPGLDKSSVVGGLREREGLANDKHRLCARLNRRHLLVGPVGDKQFSVSLRKDW